ncbi:MAG: hypothetical protein CM15mP89_0980 [Gammaproteobacteria bacterium]|nr:MAG: hypothetical protein CM15mP89_0980 [Gammaproteobacteria bacterium]
MDFYPLISDFFQRHLETTSLAVDGLAEATGAAVEQAAEAILNERKLFSIGLGRTAPAPPHWRVCCTAAYSGNDPACRLSN